MSFNESSRGQLVVENFNRHTSLAPTTRLVTVLVEIVLEAIGAGAERTLQTNNRFGDWMQGRLLPIVSSGKLNNTRMKLSEV